jgi:uncharacterized membrane protein YeaQ/YmgE (transglycosylase-associated protein family)
METIGAIISWAVFGLIVGALARLLVPGRQAMGMAMTMFLGVAGSLIGGFISWILRGGEPDMYAPAGWILSIIGAVVLILVASRFGRRRAYH